MPIEQTGFVSQNKRLNETARSFYSFFKLKLIFSLLVIH
jgi:hypothetical protein